MNKNVTKELKPLGGNNKEDRYTSYLASLRAQNMDKLNEIKQPETITRQDAAILSLFYDLPFIGMALTSPETQRWLKVNDRLCEIFGYSREELMQLSWTEITHPDDLDLDVAEFEKVMRGENEGYLMDKRFIRKDGSFVDASIDVKCVRKEDRTVDFFVATIQDISDRKLAETKQKQLEAALAESENRYRQVVQTQIDFVLRSRPDTTITFANESLCRALGSSLDQVIGLKWIDFQTDSAYIQNILLQISKLSLTNPTFSAENSDFRADGQIGWTQWINQGIFDEYGQLIGLQSTGRDVTALKQAENALQQLNNELELRVELRTLALQSSEAKFRGFFDFAPLGIAVANSKTYRFESVNQAFCQLLGYTELELLAFSSCMTISVSEDLELERPYAEALMRGEVNSYQIEKRYIKKNGEILRGSLTTTALCDQEGNITHCIGMVQDITQRKLSEELLLKNDLHLKTAQRIGKLGSWEFDIQTREAIWSEEVFRIFERDPALGTLSYRDLQKSIHPDDWENFDRVVQNAIATAQSYDVDYRVCWDDGTLLYVSARGEIICDQTGKPIQIMGTLMDISDRKESEQQFQNLTDRLTLAIKSAAIGVWEWDIANNSLIWDERTYELYAVQPDPDLDAYSAWASRVHPSDRAFAETAVQLALNGEKDYEPEFRIVLPDGSIRYLKAFALVQRDHMRAPQRMIGINFDITKRKLDEELLLKSDAHLKTAQRIGKLGSWEFELNTGEITWSEEVFRIYGYDPSLEPPSYDQLKLYIHPDDWEYFNQTVKTAISLAQSYDLEHRIIHPDGTVVYVVARGEMMFNSAGQLTHIIGTAMDITARKLAEVELNRNRDLREAIFNESTDALFLVDTQTALTIDCNHPAVSLFEASDKLELIGIEVNRLQCYPFSDKEITAIRAEVKSQGVWSQEVEYIGLQSRCFWGNLAVKQIAIAGHIFNLVRVTDISDRKLVEAKILQTAHQLESTNRELESFCYSVSHDLRAPLRHMNGFVNALQLQLQKNQSLNDSKVNHYLQVIESSSQKMGKLIDGLLTLSRYGRRPLDSRPIKIRELVDEAIEIICTDPNHNPLAEFAIGDLPIMVGDRTLLQQVFWNLIANAVKFSRNQPRPYIEIDSMPDNIIRIKDNGVGFQMEYADKLFGAFQRLHHEKEFEGTGIGLAIVQRIVQRHGGTIWAEGYPNQGATFFLKI